MGVRIPNSRDHTEVWESVSPTRGAAPKCGSAYPQLEGPRQSVGVRIPNLRDHTEVWESVSPTRGAAPKCGSAYPQLGGHAKAWECVSPTREVRFGKSYREVLGKTTFPLLQVGVTNRHETYYFSFWDQFKVVGGFGSSRGVDGTILNEVRNLHPGDFPVDF